MSRSNIRWSVFFVLLYILSLPAMVFPAEIGGDEENPFQLYFNSDPLVVEPGVEFSVDFLFRIPDQYYLYADKIQIEVTDTAGVQVGELIKPPEVTKADPFLEKNVSVYYNEVTITLPLLAPQPAWSGTKTIRGRIEFQGCSTELCYRLMKVPFALSLVTKAPVIAPLEPPDRQPEIKAGFIAEIISSLAFNDFSKILEHGLWFTLLLCFVAGFVTDFTPCVWPMIPVTLAIIGVRKDQSVTKNFLAALTLVLGMSVMYSVLGIVSAILGKSLGFLFQNIVFLIFIDVLFIAMALSLFGLFNLQLPPSLQAKISRISSTGYRGVFFIGLTMGLLAVPCVGPIVGPLLVFVAQSQNIAKGFIFLLSYALGMGIIFLVLGTFFGVLRLKLISGPWMGWFKKFLGVILMIVALFYSQSIFLRYQSAPVSENNLWLTRLDEGIRQAQAEHKPMVVDFFARWCPPCVELDHQVWDQPEMEQLIRKDWVAVKIDCTEDTKACQDAVTRFRVIGWPTVVFVSAEQEEATAERLVGKVISLKAMLDKMQRVAE